MTDEASSVGGLQRTLAVRSRQLGVSQELVRDLTHQVSAAAERAARAEHEAALLRERIAGQENAIAALQTDKVEQARALEVMRQSTSWRVTAPLRWGMRQAQRRTTPVDPVSPEGGLDASGAAPLPALDAEPADPSEAIARELFAAQQGELDADSAARAVSALRHRPLISVIMPVYQTPLPWLRRAVESLQQQYYPDWELCAVDDHSPTTGPRTLLEAMAASDGRIRLLALDANGGISAASNAGLRLARGEFIALLDHDDELTPDALLRMVEAIGQSEDADFLYSDECKIDDTSKRVLSGFMFKPDWSPELTLNAMLTSHLSVYRKALVEQLGGFRSDYDYSQDYDLSLRAAEVARRIIHVERVLYLWRSVPGSAASGGKGFARDSNIAALNDALLRRDVPGQAFALAHANAVRVAIPDETVVSIVIPSDSLANLRAALGSIRAQTDFKRYDVVVVCNGASSRVLAREFADWDRLRCVDYDRPFNFSDKCNEGARRADGDVIVFYNDDVSPLQRDWVERLVEYLFLPGVGGVSPKLLYEDDTIQYAGMIAGVPGLGGTAYNRVPDGSSDRFLSMHDYVRNVSILSGACCAMRREVFWSIGGFDAVNTPSGHSDMSLSFRLSEAGHRCVYTPYSVLRHVGRHSWGATADKDKADIHMLRHWGGALSHDPNFTRSMKRVLHREFDFDYRIFAERVAPVGKDGPDVLLVTADLEAGGSTPCIDLARGIQLAGGFVVVVSLVDGPLRAAIEEAGIVLIVDASANADHFLFKSFARNFDLAVVCSPTLDATVRQLSAVLDLPLAWLGAGQGGGAGVAPGRVHLVQARPDGSVDQLAADLLSLAGGASAA